jgi:hypothetical protein
MAAAVLVIEAVVEEKRTYPEINRRDVELDVDKAANRIAEGKQRRLVIWQSMKW